MPEAASIRSIAHGNRGMIYRDSGDDDHARADFKEAVRLDPVNVGISLIHRCLALAKGFSDGMAVYGSGVAYQKARARDMALRRCEIEQHHSESCALVETACDEFADLPPDIVPDESKRCRIGMRADLKGTLLDIRRDKKAWFVGTTTYVDTCSGLVDPVDRLFGVAWKHSRFRRAAVSASGLSLPAT